MSTDDNKLPYESFPHAQTHPQHLHTVGRLFGMSPASFQSARVLEIGCASGGDLIPLAMAYPEGEFLGLDIAEKQIEQAQSAVKELNLKNILFQNRSVTQLKPEDGLFDYIICHGVFSGVDRETQDSILEFCSKNLSPQGIAFVSFNTLPGWNLVRTLRDMMRYHAKDLEKPAEQFVQAKAVLQFVKENVDANSLYGRLLQEEVAALDARPETHQFHEYLEPINEPLYFNDFMAKNFKNSSSKSFIGWSKIVIRIG
jgi:2-polyprenyl-3-methyl-5-hydroxy-6-metoxy-1,4-benzoquinol methylase